MAKVNTYLNFNGNTEEAFNFYKSVFGGEFLNVTRFKDMGDMPGMDKMPEADKNKLMHIALRIGKDDLLMATDAVEAMGHKVTPGNNFYIQLEADSVEEAERLFGRLAEGGKVETALDPTGWAERYGSLADKYGVQWMVNYTGDVQFGA
jgi:PhnB protein